MKKHWIFGLKVKASRDKIHRENIPQFNTFNSNDETIKQAYINIVEAKLKSTETCPRCSNRLVLRSARNRDYAGRQFYDRSNFPNFFPKTSSKMQIRFEAQIAQTAQTAQIAQTAQTNTLSLTLSFFNIIISRTFYIRKSLLRFVKMPLRSRNQKKKKTKNFFLSLSSQIFLYSIFKNTSAIFPIYQHPI